MGWLGFILLLVHNRARFRWWWQASGIWSLTMPFVCLPHYQLEIGIQWRNIWSGVQWGDIRSCSKESGFAWWRQWILLARTLPVSVSHMSCSSRAWKLCQTCPCAGCHLSMSQLYWISKWTPDLSFISVKKLINNLWLLENPCSLWHSSMQTGMFEYQMDTEHSPLDNLF